MPRCRCGSMAGYFSDENLEQLADVLCLHGNGKRSANDWPERSPEVDFDHAYFLAALIALSTRGGDMGMWVMRTPVAFDTALAIAASGGTMEVSPTPRTP